MHLEKAIPKKGETSWPRWVYKDRDKKDLLLRGELEGMLRRSTEKPLDGVRGPRARHNICVSSKSIPNLSVWSKEIHTAHVLPQVTIGACLFRSGTYRARRDKVHVICFPEKSARIGRNETIL